MPDNTIPLFTQFKDESGYSGVFFKTIKLKRKIVSLLSERKEITVDDISKIIKLSHNNNINT